MTKHMHIFIYVIFVVGLNSQTSPEVCMYEKKNRRLKKLESCEIWPH